MVKSIISMATAALLANTVSANVPAAQLKTTYFPANATDVKTFTTPTGVQIRYKEPGKDGVCETTPGVNSYSSYIDIAPNVHTFFWFFESRSNPASDPITLWLNGGPGSDSLLGLFQENDPCRITENLTSVINPYSWNNVSNLLFISQPVGTGFSYQEEAIGKLQRGYPILDPVDVGTIDTTDLAAVATWHVLQGFLSGLSTLDAKFGGHHNKNFNLWTESYGGHYGPAFYNYFYQQNELIKNSSIIGYGLNFDTLGIGNGIIDAAIQQECYPEFAMKNTYGIKAYNETAYNYAKFALNMPNGCLDQIDGCRVATQSIKGGFKNGKITNVAASNPSIAALCSEAASMCRDNVEGLYYNLADRGSYDIRHPQKDVTPPTSFVKYLNIPEVQNALGVNLNYTDLNVDVYWQFQATGDNIYSNFIADLEEILSYGVRVALYYGDADYPCNWFGGQAISLAANYANKKEFALAEYEPMTWDGKQYGEVREYGNFSFTRIYESGHEVPYYQPQAALALFNCSIHHVNIADGTKPVTSHLASHGGKNSTLTEPYVSLPPTATASYAAWSASVLASYASLDNTLPTGTPV